eukprot:804357_1
MPAKYYHFAKGLVEAVQNFGIKRCVSEKDNEFSLTGGIYEKGPFYCGLSKILNIASFDICFHGPCSTSKDIEIAINFATRGGIIIELQNDQYAEGAQERCFDCSWISHYSDENERLFIAGEFRLRMSSIIIVETGHNF